MRILASLLLIVVSLTLPAKKNVKYVFYMIGDGMGINSAYAADIFNREAGLPEVNFLDFPVKTIITTHAANSLVTDSAASGTALASGSKTLVSRLGNDENGNPLTSIAELAKEKGYGVGIISSVGVNHATPAAFYGHVDERNMHDILARQLIDSKVDFAAGATIHADSHKPEYWVEEARKAGIEVYQGHGSYIPTDKRVLCLPSSLKHGDLPYAIDRQEGDTELADFTRAAIDHLYSNYAKKGFFLMVEGGSIDHACHSNDAATAFHEINDFCVSIEMALEFYRQHKDETLIVVTADHDTGGMSLGNGRYEMHLDRLKGQTCSVNTLTSRLNQLIKENGKDATWEQARAIIQDAFGLWSVVPVDSKAEEEMKVVFAKTISGEAATEKDLYSTNSKLATLALKYLSGKAMVGWISRSHSGSPLGLYVIGRGAESFISANDNTDIPKLISKLAKY